MSGASLTKKHEVNPTFRDTVILERYIYFVGQKELKFSIQWPVSDLTANTFWFTAGAKILLNQVYLLLFVCSISCLHTNCLSNVHDC